MIVNKVERKAEFNKFDLVKYQILTHCHFNKIDISDASATCFTNLCLAGKTKLSDFCKLMSDKKVFKSSQVVRNVIGIGVNTKIVMKEGDERNKLIYINPSLNIQYEGNVLLDFKFFSRESIQS